MFVMTCHDADAAACMWTVANGGGLEKRRGSLWLPATQWNPRFLSLVRDLVCLRRLCAPPAPRNAAFHVTKAPREGASFITSQSELGVIRAGCGGAKWGKIGGFFRLTSIWSWAKPCCQRGLCWARFRSFRVSGLLDSQRKKRLPLMLLMLAWACRLLMPVVCC